MQSVVQRLFGPLQLGPGRIQVGIRQAVQAFRQGLARPVRELKCQSCWLSPSSRLKPL